MSYAEMAKPKQVSQVASVVVDQPSLCNGETLVPIDQNLCEMMQSLVPAIKNALLTMTYLPK